MTKKELVEQLQNRKNPPSNKTGIFLSHVLLGHGEEFVKKLDTLNPVYYSCKDNTNGHEIPESLTVVFRIEKELKNKLELISFIKTHSSYITDYPIGDLLYDKLHAAVFRIPEMYLSSYDAFMKSKYSQMYLEPTQRKMFEKEYYGQFSIQRQNLLYTAKQVIFKTESAKNKLLDKLGLDELPDDIEYESSWHKVTDKQYYFNIITDEYV